MSKNPVASMSDGRSLKLMPARLLYKSADLDYTLTAGRPEHSS